MMGFNPFTALGAKLFAGTTLALAAALAWQSVQVQRWHAAADRWQAAHAAQAAASRAYKALAEAQTRAREAQSRLIAKEADDDHQIALGDARAAVRRHAAANRCLYHDGSDSGTAAAAAQGAGARLPADLPADTGLVAVPQSDLQAFAEWVAFGVAAHNHAVDRIAAGTAEPAQ